MLIKVGDLDAFLYKCGTDQLGAVARFGLELAAEEGDSPSLLPCRPQPPDAVLKRLALPASLVDYFAVDIAGGVVGPPAQLLPHIEVRDAVGAEGLFQRPLREVRLIAGVRRGADVDQEGDLMLPEQPDDVVDRPGAVAKSEKERRGRYCHACADIVAPRRGLSSVPFFKAM